MKHFFLLLLQCLLFFSLLMAVPGKALMVSIPDKVLSKETATFLKTHQIMGVILMGHNVKNEQQVKTLTTDLKNQVSSRLVIAIDQEGGTVVRLPWLKHAKLSAKEIGSKKTITEAKQIAYERGLELKALGINMNMAPVCDVALITNSYMKNRSFGTNADKVARYVRATVEGQKKAKIHSVLKHFPGHGRTSVDSHQAIPELEVNLTQLDEQEWVPFKEGIQAGAKWIMIGHIIHSGSDDIPASQNKNTLKMIERLSFDGVLITDDLSMLKGAFRPISWGVNLWVGQLNLLNKRDEFLREVRPEQQLLKRLGKIIK